MDDLADYRDHSLVRLEDGFIRVTDPKNPRVTMLSRSEQEAHEMIDGRIARKEKLGLR